jgi:hypothetical protein
LQSRGETANAKLELAGTMLTGSPRDKHDLVSQLFANAASGVPGNQAIVANIPNYSAVNVISTESANWDSNFVGGSSGGTRPGIMRFVEVAAAELQSDTQGCSAAHQLHDRRPEVPCQAVPVRDQLAKRLMLPTRIRRISGASPVGCPYPHCA